MAWQLRPNLEENFREKRHTDFAYGGSDWRSLDWQRLRHAD
jgi:hypothetical protein